jgi:hypothetical protein
MNGKTMMLALLLAWHALPGSAQDAEPAAVPPAATSGEPEKAATETAPKAPAPSAPAPKAATADSAASSPERFEPSEKVRADFDVSFPVDI